MPAGKIDPKEDRLVAAKRELAEETGFRAKRWKPLARYYASPGFLAEWMQIYLAEGLTPGDTSPDEDERIELFFVPLSELLRLIDSGSAVVDVCRQIGDLEPTLMRHGYRLKDMIEQFDAKPGRNQGAIQQSA